MTEPFNLTIEEASKRIRFGQLSPLALVQACLKRVTQVEPQVNAFIAVMHEQALERAQQLTDEVSVGGWRGPLHGIPVAIKDLIDVAGVPTTGGTSFLANTAAHSNADVVENLHIAGAVIVGKTNLHELALGATNINPHMGNVQNPWDGARIAGGSSGGSAAAVAAGMCLAALGTDTGGSVRLPAAFCNLVGLRPSVGLVASRGAIPLSESLDAIGPITRTATDTKLLLDGLLGVETEGIDPTPQTIAVVRNGYFWERTEDVVAEQIEHAVEVFAAAGYKIIEVELEMVREANRAAGIISIYEPAPRYIEQVQSDPASVGTDVRSLVERGTQHTEAEYQEAVETGKAWRAHLEDIFAQTDLLLTPVTPFPPLLTKGPELEQLGRYLLRFLFPFSLSGLPATSVPCGFTEDALPIGMQLIGQSESSVLSAATDFQRRTNYHEQYPVL